MTDGDPASGGGGRLPTRAVLAREAAAARQRPASAGVPAVAAGGGAAHGEGDEDTNGGGGGGGAADTLTAATPADDARPSDLALVCRAWEVGTTDTLALTELVHALLVKGGRFTCAEARKEYAIAVASLRVLGRVDRLPLRDAEAFLAKIFAIVCDGQLHDTRADNLDWDEPWERTREAGVRYLLDAGRTRHRPWEAGYGLADNGGWAAYNKDLKGALARHYDHHSAGMVVLAELQAALRTTSFGNVQLRDALKTPLARLPFSGDPAPCPVDVCGVVIPTTAEYWTTHIPTGTAVLLLNAATGAVDAKEVLARSYGGEGFVGTPSSGGGGGGGARSPASSTGLPQPAQRHVCDMFLRFARNELPRALAETAAAAAATASPAAPRMPSAQTFRSRTAHPLVHSHLQCLRCSRYALAIDQDGAPMGAFSKAEAGASLRQRASVAGGVAMPGGGLGAAYCSGCDATHVDWQRVPTTAAAGVLQARYNWDVARHGSPRWRERDADADAAVNRTIDYSTIVDDAAREEDEARAAADAARQPGETSSICDLPHADTGDAGFTDIISAMTPSVLAGTPQVTQRQRTPHAAHTPMSLASPSPTLSYGLTPSPAGRHVLASPPTDERPVNPFSRNKHTQRTSSSPSRPKRPGRPATAPTAPPRQKLYNMIECPRCERGMLAIDQHGAPLLAGLESGRPVPVGCPGCGVTSAGWAKKSFWDNQSKFEAGARAATRRRFQQPLEAHLAREKQRADLVAQKRKEKEEIVQQRARAARHSARLAHYKTNGPPEGFATDEQGELVVPLPLLECLRCGRPQLRIDQCGGEIGLSESTQGGPQPLDCPGCATRHTDWTPRPLPPRTLAKGDRWWEKHLRQRTTDHIPG